MSELSLADLWRPVPAAVDLLRMVRLPYMIIQRGSRRRAPDLSPSNQGEMSNLRPEFSSLLANRHGKAPSRHTIIPLMNARRDFINQSAAIRDVIPAVMSRRILCFVRIGFV